MFKIAIVGSGPSGLFLTKNLLKSFPNKVKIDIFEKLPEPLGLIRFGVAPDHSDVKKKFMRHFDSIFDSNDVKIYTSADIGRDLTVSYLSKYYDAVALCTGMSDSKRFWGGIPNCRGADEIFGWYNQSPSFKILDQDLSKVQRLVVIGNGNVALDMARIFGKKSSLLDKDIIAPEVLRTLKNTNVTDITIIGRRGLENASFTPSELREFKILSDYCKITSTPEYEYEVSKTNELSRVHAKNIQIMQGLLKCSNHMSYDKIINFKFSSPVTSVKWGNGRGIISIVDKNQKTEQIEFDLLIECTGFKQNQKFENLAQDEVGRFITCDKNLLKDNIYACGWARTGPKGNIADSMSEALTCAESISNDLLRKQKDQNIKIGVDLASVFRKHKFEKYK